MEQCIDCGKAINLNDTYWLITRGVIDEHQDNQNHILGYYDTVSEGYLCTDCYSPGTS